MRRGVAPSLLALLSVVCLERSAHAVDCTPASGVSSCVDSNSLWLAAGTSRWLSLPSRTALPAGRVGVLFSEQLYYRPLRFSIASSTTSGREVRAVESVAEQALVLSAGLGHSLELGLSLPLVLHQSGAGVGGVTSQQSPPLETSAPRDPHLSLGRAVSLNEQAGLKPRLELSLPLGSRDAYASTGSVTVAPALPLEVEWGRFDFAVELGVRLRRSVDLGSARWGSQALVAAGAAVDVLPRELISLAAEAFVLQPFGSSSSAAGERAGIDTHLLPAEFIASLRSRPLAQQPFTVSIAAGSSFQLSSARFADGERHFAAPTSPSLRLLAAVRYAPLD